jgi:hypothetical protein
MIMDDKFKGIVTGYRLLCNRLDKRHATLGRDVTQQGSEVRNVAGCHATCSVNDIPC